MIKTKNVANFIRNTTYEDLPAEAVRKAKYSLLDSLGCALAGSTEPASIILTNFVRNSHSAPESGVIAGGYKTIPSNSAWVNGATAHALDYDDFTLTSWIGHPSVAVLPAVLALAEKNNLPGRDAILAYLIGLEVGAKIGNICGKNHYDIGWHNTATIGSIAASAAVSKLLNLPEDQTRVALGIAASLASGLRQNFGTMTKPLHAGNAARNGVVSAQLAGDGFTADQEILESELGFYRVLNGGKDCANTEVQHLGSPWDIVSPGIGLKPYPSCAFSHWAIDATLLLVEEQTFLSSDVARIELRAHSSVPNICIHSSPQNALEAKFSLQYCVAIALITGKASLNEFTDRWVADSGVRSLIEKVKYIHGPEYEKNPWGGELGIALKNGQVYSKKIDVPKGWPNNPMSDAEIVNKYVNCAKQVLSKEQVTISIEQVLNLEGKASVSNLMKILTYGNRDPG